MAPDLIIYVSCNPVTLARDLRLILSPPESNLSEAQTPSADKLNSCSILNNGYKVEKIIPIDLFPQTYHIESISILKKQ
jgi:23S rRNA (uracil1939-C5)-methyltransferase